MALAGFGPRPNVARVTGFLRFVGIANAAAWLGACLFYTLGAGPAMLSADMLALLGPKYFPYFSGAVGLVLLERYFLFHIVCASVALLHAFAERFYLGRRLTRGRLGLLAALLAFGVAGSAWLAPKLTRLHRIAHAQNAAQVTREAAARSFRVWHGVFQGVNVLVIAGVAGCLWRVTHPRDELRFLGTQFQS